MNDMSYMKPLPEPSQDTAPYWEALNQGTLKLQCCADCGKVRHYPMNANWKASAGRGTVHSWTIAHHAFHPGFKGELPYPLVTVELEEGVRMQSQFRGKVEDLKIGLPVKVAFEIATKDLTLPVFIAA